MPPLLVSETEITKVHSQYSSVMICVSRVILLTLVMVWGLCTCKFVVQPLDKSLGDAESAVTRQCY